MAQLNYKHLRYFWAVAHEGNLTRTAERLAVSQSALSSQIQALEAQLGHALFERQGRRLVLTEAGRIALDHADAIFALGGDLVGTLGHAPRTTRRALRVGALATLSRNFQIAFLRPVLGREDVEVVLRSGGLRDLMAALEGHRLDVVLVNREPARDAASPWVAHRIAEQPVALYGTPSRLGAGGDLGALLDAHPLVLPTVDSGVRNDFDALAERLGLRPRIAAEVDDMAMLRLLAREDVGLALVPPVVVQDELRSGALVEAASPPGLVERFFALTAPRRFPNPLLAALIERDVVAEAADAP